MSGATGRPLGGTDTTLRGLPLALACLVAAAFAGLVLLCNAPLYDLEELHIQYVYVDQAGYILTGRILAETGELRNGVVFPAQIDNPDFYVHMPGHVTLLAASYLLFGWGVAQSLLPSVCGYVLGAVGVLLIGNRLYGVRAGLFASLLFALVPTHVAYGFTAMAELTFACASIAAVAAFVHLPPRWLPFGPPLLLVLPFLFRETGAFLVIPMALCVAHVRGWRAAALASAGSVATLWLVNRWQVASGKIEASMAWVTQGSFNYGDAFAPPPPELSPTEFLEALGANVRLNLAHLEEHVRQVPGELMPWALYAVGLVALPVLALGLARRRTDPFALGAGLLTVFVGLLAFAVYDVKAHKLLRMLTYTVPFGLVALCGWLTPSASLGRRGLGRVGLALLVVGAVLFSGRVSGLAAHKMTQRDTSRQRNTETLTALHRRGMIVAGNIAAPLSVRGYPAITWCLTTENEETLALVLERYDVQTIVLFKQLSPAFVREHGLALVHSQRIGRLWHHFYKPAG